MQLYTPMVSVGILTWGRWLSCDWVMPKFFTLFEQVNTLDEATALSICNQGIDMFFDNYFTAGDEVLPWANTFTWAGTPLEWRVKFEFNLFWLALFINNKMKTKLFLAICIASLTISSVQADLQTYLDYVFMLASPSLIPTYSLLDSLIMTFFKPIIWTVFYNWSSPLICA